VRLSFQLLKCWLAGNVLLGGISCQIAQFLIQSSKLIRRCAKPCSKIIKRILHLRDIDLRSDLRSINPQLGTFNSIGIAGLVKNDYGLIDNALPLQEWLCY